MRASGACAAKVAEQVPFQLLDDKSCHFHKSERKYNSCQIILSEVILLLFSDFTFNIEISVENGPKLALSYPKIFEKSIDHVHTQPFIYSLDLPQGI